MKYVYYSFQLFEFFYQKSKYYFPYLFLIQWKDFTNASSVSYHLPLHRNMGEGYFNFIIIGAKSACFRFLIWCCRFMLLSMEYWNRLIKLGVYLNIVVYNCLQFYIIELYLGTFSQSLVEMVHPIITPPDFYQKYNSVFFLAWLSYSCLFESKYWTKFFEEYSSLTVMELIVTPFCLFYFYFNTLLTEGYTVN